MNRQQELLEVKKNSESHAESIKSFISLKSN